jgi:pSer/pThr/pTyr-binding forkhead associated (FHA) protein
MRGKLVSGDEKWGFEIPRVVLGRGETCDIRVSDPSASRQHAELWINYQLQYMVMDCGSRNGTYLNEHLICGPSLLKQGDVIRIGKQTFEFHGNVSGQGAAPTSVIKVGQGQSNQATKFPVAMLAVRLFENKEVLVKEPIVYSCGLGQWFSKQIETIAKNHGYINHLSKRMVFAYWQAEAGDLTRVVETVANCAKESLAITKSLDEEFKMAIDDCAGQCIMTSAVALHLGKVEGREVGSPGSEFYVMGGLEIENCADITLRAEPSLDGFVCAENLSKLMPGLPRKPLSLVSLGPRQQSVMLYQMGV